MIEIQITETDAAGEKAVTRFSRNVDRLDIEATIAAISNVIAKAPPTRKRRSDAGTKKGGAL